MSAVAPLRITAFRRLFAARTITYLGNAIAPIALGFAVLDITGSVTALGVVVAARSLANVAFVVIGGVIADRLPRQIVLSGSELTAALTQGVTAALVLTGAASMPALVILSVVNGAAAAVSFPAASALVPQTVPARQLREANALSRLGVNAALIGGAAAGGALVAVTSPGWGLAVDALTFAVAAALFAGVRTTVTRATDRNHTMLTDLRDGWRTFRSHTWIWIVVVQAAAINAALAGGSGVLGPLIADATFGRAGWGIVMALQSAGFVLGGIVALRWQPARALLWGVALTSVVAVPLVIMALSPTLIATGLAFLAAGLAVEQFAVAWDVNLQHHIPAGLLARVYAYDMLGSLAAIPLGQVLVGPTADRIGTTPTLIGAAMIVLIATALALASRPVRQLSTELIDTIG